MTQRTTAIGVFFYFACLFFGPLGAQNGWFERPLSPRTANYQMKIRLDPDEKMIYGEATLVWKNPSPDTVGDLQFHLYYNAFKNTGSTFYRRSNRLSRLPDSDACFWGSNEMSDIRDGAGRALQSRYIQPDDGNTDDETVLQVLLREPVLPFDSVRVTYRFVAKIPKIMVRTGYSRDYFFLAQWYPKVGVYEPAGTRNARVGGWNCHQYHSNTEYYGEFGVYDVDLTVPADYVVGASGSLQGTTDSPAGTTHRYHVEDVIDFTWTASPKYLVFEDQWKHVRLKVLAFPGHECYVERYFEAAKHSLDFFDEHLATYPYHTLTMVDVPYHGLFTGAMEYPTLISVLSLDFFPKGVLFSETLTVHELTHQFFQQIVATNEQEEPWLDEGFTTYWEGRIMDQYYGEKSSAFKVLGVGAGNVEYNRIEFLNMGNPKITSCAQSGFDTKADNYRTIFYNKTAIWLRTLEGLVGEATMSDIWKTYYEKWKFKHPGGRDFTDVVNEVVRKNHGDRFGDNLDWFFEQVLYGTDMCDYAVSDISVTPVLPKAGILDDGTCVGLKQTNAPDQWRSKITIYRNGEVLLPLDVLIHFEDGTEVREHWDGRDRYRIFEYTKPAKVAWAEVDPERKLHLDADFTNNGMRLKPDPLPAQKYGGRLLAWVQNLLEVLAFFV
ncbi:MAG: M1 family peptidase [Bacteroidetes bacterium]|nr:MAG: M1 family peptidase [Bacteroidota bacterium]